MSDALTIAVPRGNLFDETLDLLDGLGIDTAEVRANERKLLFADAGIVTMRPSDVPTYVEHGAADLGITGKDVLLEQDEREVYELLDLGYGRCRMVVAAREGDDALGESLRRLGRVRVATKYPRIADRWFAETGRQAEIVEVKGSVELAPLTGLVDGIVDLTASGRTLAENHLEVVEEITECTARLIANPVAHKLKAEAIDALVERIRERVMRIVRDRLERPAPPPAVTDAVREVIDEVRRDGDRAILSLTARFDQAELAPDQIQVDPREVEASVGVLEPDVLDGLRKAIENVRAVAQAQLREPVAVELPEGQSVEIAEVPVRRVGVYAPGGRAAYPSTVVMCAVTARAAGVEEIAVCAPPGPGGRAHPAILAACVLCGVTEVYRMGGAQAIAALAYGSESVLPVDLIAGPGNAYVQEAKRQVVGQVGIDGIAGPSELIVLAGAGADPESVALDLLAQGEHGEDSLLAVIGWDRGLLEAIAEAVERLAPERPSVADAELMVNEAEGPRQALDLAERIAPEHLQLVGEEAEALADQVRAAGCVFVGAGAGTAFGDYVAGSNHVLPTGGAARFQSALSPATFRRRMARVSLPGEAPGRLAPAGAAIARAEGFPVHAESMERRSPGTAGSAGCDRMIT